jgi:hypothetical protein
MAGGLVFCIRVEEREAEFAEWFRYESMINLSFASAPATIVCTYDARSLPDSVLVSARRTPGSCEGQRCHHEFRLSRPRGLPADPGMTPAPHTSRTRSRPLCSQALIGLVGGRPNPGIDKAWCWARAEITAGRCSCVAKARHPLTLNSPPRSAAPLRLTILSGYRPKKGMARSIRFKARTPKPTGRRDPTPRAAALNSACATRKGQPTWTAV